MVNVQYKKLTVTDEGTRAVYVLSVNHMSVEVGEVKQILEAMKEESQLELVLDEKGCLQTDIMFHAHVHVNLAQKTVLGFRSMWAENVVTSKFSFVELFGGLLGGLLTVHAKDLFGPQGR